MKVDIEVIFGGKVIGGGTMEYKRTKLEGINVSGTIKEVKDLICEELSKLGRDEEPEEMEMFSDTKLIGNPEDVSVLQNLGTIFAVILKDGSSDEAWDTNVKGCGTADKFIITGNNWNFRVYSIPANKTTPVPIQANTFSKFFNQEHKFAVVERKEADGKWRGRRYELREELKENQTIHLKDNGEVWLVINPESGAEERLKETAEEKLYDPVEKASRKRKTDVALIIGGLILAAAAL